jgi:TRAP-type C4-dicarboxylate transport system permease small subunit
LPDANPAATTTTLAGDTRVTHSPAPGETRPELKATTPAQRTWRPEQALEMLAAALLFAMMVLTFVDVVLRYVFNAPIRGGFEVSETMMAILIFAGLPMVSRKGEHITIDSLVRLAPPRLRQLGAIVVQLGCAAALMGMAWLLWLRAMRFSAAGDVTQTLKLPIAPVVQLMALLTVVTAIIHIILAWQALRAPDGGPRSSGDDGGGIL